ncbi:conjugal transfer protein TraF [Methylomonas lenta]|uniref:Conjugal transfer protein TraF n=1 Tax=Methylomonas lenta TaxID=980561 RepID=A0A177NAC5_9GAMM|nr:conjugative transfer signal peptidase TraF [Methylomonas lenta]OAI14544.1 conjugal transfer protein TraF [Methylomonas lenta]
MKRLTSLIAILGISYLALCGIAYAVGARFNSTRSIPVGLYWETRDPVEKGAYVMFCPPQTEVFDLAKTRGYIGAGYCPGGYGYMMKKILAAKTDVVSVDDDGVRVNDVLLPYSTPFDLDGAGRPMPRFRATHELGESEVLLMTDMNKGSFDGRYFGLINRSQITGVIRPVLTW